MEAAHVRPVEPLSRVHRRRHNQRVSAQHVEDLVTQPAPDTKDWTWVLDRVCPECGFDAQTVTRTDYPRLTGAYAEALIDALDGESATVRPAPEVWSPTEYACHARDVCRTFEARLDLMLAEDDPQFANWDQDEAAVADRYWEQAPEQVAVELAVAADSFAAKWGAVTEDQWQRPGRRSNGSTFTVESLGAYFLHDLAHHAWDVRS